MSWDVSNLEPFEYSDIPEDYAEKIQENISILLENIIITDHFLKRMEPVDGRKGYSHGFTRSMMSDIARSVKRCEAPEQRSYKVLSFIQYRSKECFREFIHCLVETNQAELAAFMDYDYAIKLAPKVLKTMRTIDCTPYEDKPVELPEKWPAEEVGETEKVEASTFEKVPFDLLQKHAAVQTYLFRGSGYFRGRCVIFNLHKDEKEQAIADKDLKKVQELYEAIGYYCIVISTSMEKYQKLGLTAESVTELVDFAVKVTNVNCPSYMLVVMSKSSQVERNEKGELVDYLIHCDNDTTVKASALVDLAKNAENLKDTPKIFSFHGTVAPEEIKPQAKPAEPEQPMEVDENEKKQETSLEFADMFFSMAICDQDYYLQDGKNSKYFQAMNDVYLLAAHIKPWEQLQNLSETLLLRLNEDQEKVVYNCNHKMQENNEKKFYFFPNVNLLKFFTIVPLPESRGGSRKRYY